MLRASDSISAMVCSATETALPPGVFITSTPACVAADRSTLSTPTPARPITRSFGAFERTSVFTFTALRTMRASASARWGAYSLGLETMTSQPACARSRSTAAGARGSAISIFIAVSNRSAGRDANARDFGVNLLHRGDALPELHIDAVGGEDDLELGHHGKQIREIEIPEMRDAEDLSLHRALPVRDDG